MENHHDNVVPQIRPASEYDSLPTLDAVEVAVGLEEKPTYAGDSGGDHGGNTAAIASGGGGETEVEGKRKRGRPAKQPMTEAEEDLMDAQSEYLTPPQKRGRGRPKGSGKWQTLAASFGGSIKNATGSNFIPYVLPIQTGENIAQKLLSFSQCTPHSVCILSACGTVSHVDIVQPCLRGTILRYQGRFDIVSLKGSFVYSENAGSRKQKNNLLTVQFVDGEGIFYGGVIAGSLIAACPTQLMVATFKQKLEEQTKGRHKLEGSNSKSNKKMENGNLTEAEVQRASANNGNLTDGGEGPGASAISPVPISSADAINVVAMSSASLQPCDWNSSQPSMLPPEFVDQGPAHP